MLEPKKVHSKKLRNQANDFFAAHINDPSRFPVYPLDVEKENLGGASDVVLVRSGNAIAAAAHYSAPYSEAIPLPLQPENRAAALKDFIMLYSIAVAKERRGTGLGAKLLTHVEEQALATGHQVIYGVCEPDSKGFYERNGYSIGAPNEPLTLQWGTRKAQFPMVGQAHWFWKDLAENNGRTLVLNPPRGELAHTSAFAAHLVAPAPGEPSLTSKETGGGPEEHASAWKRLWNWLVNR